MANFIESKDHKNPEDFYKSLKEKLEATHNFPEDYQFKFIVTNEEQKITEIYRIFDDMKFTLTTRDSKNAKYTSLTLTAFVLDADHVISIYKKVGEIEGVMSL
jgi:putative lipoic acid-binding regulatory protein